MGYFSKFVLDPISKDQPSTTARSDVLWKPDTRISRSLFELTSQIDRNWSTTKPAARPQTDVELRVSLHNLDGQVDSEVPVLCRITPTDEPCIDLTHLPQASYVRTNGRLSAHRLQRSCVSFKKYSESSTKHDLSHSSNAPPGL